MELHSLCCNFDLEDKLNLSQLTPQSDTPVALCVIDPRITSYYHPPKSTSTQAQICRFMQEALHAQFHFLKLSGQELNEFSLARCLKLAEQQLEFFLQKHQWQASVHAVIFIPSGKKFELLKIVSIGSPSLFSPNDKEILEEPPSQNKPPRRGFGSSYPFTMESWEIPLTKPQRYVIGFLSSESIMTSRSQELLSAGWKDLPEIILEMINNQDPFAQPFFIIQISTKKPAWLQGLLKFADFSLHMAKKLAGLN